MYERLRGAFGHAGWWPGDSPFEVCVGAILVQNTAWANVERTLERFGGIDVLINNAGVGLYQPAWRASLAAARAMFELNLFAPLDLIQLIVPVMRPRGGGVIVNVSSIAGKVTLPWLTLYSASKQALWSLGDGLRIELKPLGIHVMTVFPGYVKTGFGGHALEGGPPPRLARYQRFAISPEQCAAAIVRGLERGAHAVVAPAVSWGLVAASRLFPRLTARQLARIHRDLELAG